jgi:hypothetical protein
MYSENENLRPLDLMLPKEIVIFLRFVAAENDMPVQELAQYMVIDKASELRQAFEDGPDGPEEKT